MIHAPLPCIVHADVVLPGDAPALYDGAVVLNETGTIVDVGSADRVLPNHTGAPIERVTGAVGPGLINAHTHLELSAMHRKVPGGNGFVPWVERMMAIRASEKPDEDRVAIRRAVEQMDCAGTAAVCEVSNSLSGLSVLQERSLAGIVFREILGLAPEAALASFERARRELETQRGLSRHARKQEGPADLDLEIAPPLHRFRSSMPPAEGPADPDLEIAPAAHTLYTTHPDAVRAVLGLARQHGLRTTIHLAEHHAERTFLESGDGPFGEFVRRLGLHSPKFPLCKKGPVRLASELGLLASDVLLVHLTDVRDDEIPLVAESGATVVLCPRSNLFIERRLPRLPDWLKAGVVPALGTDSLASNDSLDVLAEAETLARACPEVPARTLFEMATSVGARALGRSDLGRVAIGTRPGLIAFDGQVCDDPFAWAIAQPPSHRRWVARRRRTS